MRSALVLFIIAATSFAQIVHAQDGSEITFKGLVTIDRKLCKGAELLLCRTSAASPDCAKISTMTTEKNGQFEFMLAKDNSYRIVVKKEGFVDRTVEVNTSLPKEAIDPNKLVFQAEIELTLYAEAKEPLTVARVYFDAEKGSFDYSLPQE